MGAKNIIHDDAGRADVKNVYYYFQCQLFLLRQEVAMVVGNHCLTIIINMERLMS